MTKFWIEIQQNSNGSVRLFLATWDVAVNGETRAVAKYKLRLGKGFRLSLLCVKKSGNFL